MMVWGVPEIEHYTRNGSIGNPAESANPGMLAVGAAHWDDVRAIEPYSSRGPTPDGRVKPDVVGADCGATSLIPLNNRNNGFCGTSQAASHVAGLAALVKQRFPSYTPQQVAVYLKDNAEQRQSPDPNNTWGHGFARLPSVSSATPLPMVVFADLNWSSALIQNQIARYIIENGYGYPTDAMFGTSEALQRALLKGDIHVVMEVWLPNQQQTWEAGLASGRILSLGSSLGNDWQSAFVIPAYLQEQYPELDNVEDLKYQRYRDLFKTAETGDKARLVSCVAGWACEVLNREQIEGYGLTDHVHIVLPTSDSDLHASLKNAYERREPWLGYQWGTSDAALLLDLARLEEPEYSEECWSTNKACAYQDAMILIGAHSSLPDLAPDVVDFLRNWDFSVEVHLRNVARWQADNPGSSIEDTALYWLSNNADTWSQWVTNQADARIRAALDREALVALYNATGGANWTNKGNWLTNTPIGQWHGVTTDANGRVTELDLRENRLTGTIPAQLGNLANLERLYLYDNRLTGTIPAELGNLTNLQVLNLRINQLSGPIPAELGNLTRLTYLSLRSNQLSGQLPQTLKGLTMLQRFFFYRNLGLCAPVDNAFQTWLRGIGTVSGSSCAPVDSQEDRAVLEALYNATGGADWTNKANWLSARPTREWYGVTTDANGRVNGLYLWENQLTGTIPAELGSLTNLNILNLSSNQLSGPIPAELGSLANLTFLSLSSNQLSGQIPVELGNLANLTYLFLYANQLTGTIPTELGNLTNLEILNLHNNQLTGSIPAELGRLTNLTALYLAGNQLTGCVPASFRSVSDNDFARLGLPFCTVAPPVGATATRSFSPASVSPGGRVTVTITAANYGTAGVVTETLPQGFTYVSSSLSGNQVTVTGQVVRFTLQGATSFTYTVTAPSVAGPYTFSGTLMDSNQNDHAVGGAATVTVTAAPPTNVTATRSFSPATVAPGGRVTVTITAANYGRTAGVVTETLPAGFSYVSSTHGLVTHPVDGNSQMVRFTLLGETSFTYTVTAPSVEGSYTFSGTLRDSDRNDHVVGGAATVTVSSGDPLIARYDTNGNGVIERSEVIKAINDYLFGTGPDAPSRADVIRLINLYLFG